MQADTPIDLNGLISGVHNGKLEMECGAECLALMDNRILAFVNIIFFQSEIGKCS